MKKLLLTTTFIFAISLILIPKAQATTCVFPASGNAGISADCSIDADTVNGPDTGTLTANTAELDVSAGTIIIQAGGTLATGSIVLSGGNIALGTNTQIKLDTAIWVEDADEDGYAASFIFYIASDTDLVRRNLLSSITEVDCNEAAFEANNCCLAPEYC